MVIGREISDPGFVPIGPTRPYTGNGLTRLQAPEGRNSLASGVSHWLGRQVAKAPEGRHTATNVAGNRTAPRTCEPKEHAAYVAPPGLPEYTHRSSAIIRTQPREPPDSFWWDQVQPSLRPLRRIDARSM